MDFFEHIEKAPADPILGLSVDFLADRRKNKVNLGAGVYKTSDLKPFILNSVKKAESILLETETSKDYIPIDGMPDYVQLTKALVFGKIANSERIYGAQTVGGTMALRLGGTFLKEIGFGKIYLSTPTWVNHMSIFQQLGLHVHSYPYFNRKTKGLDLPSFLQELKGMDKGSIVLLQACCHNPTGIDPSSEEWEEICEIIQAKDLFPFFDLAYQGFGDGLEQDRTILSLFLNKGLRCAVAVSNSKNFGLYAERCGALFFVCEDENQADLVGSHVKAIVRGLYSSPPCHGGRIVTIILQDKELVEHWKKELTSMKERITEMRNSLVLGLQSKTASSTFDFLKTQKGMFSYTGLSEEQVERLIANYGIYLLRDGRINVAGLNAQNLEYVIDAIVEVVIHQSI